MSLGTRRAIWLGEHGRLSVKEISDNYEPFEHQALVKISFSAINPADLTHAFVGLFGSIAGLAWVGSVIQTGAAAPFNVGQDLFGATMPGRERPVYLGGHQDYIIVDGRQHAWPVPPGVSHEDAVSVPVAAGTACDALLNILGFGCAAAGLSGRDATNVPILIWGGGSAVGCAAIQIAKTAGFAPILTTASSRNHEKLTSLGAQVFDYTSSSVVEDIKKAVAQSGGHLHVVFDAVCAGLGKLGSGEEKAKNNTPDLARRCLSDGEVLLASVLPVPHDPSWKLCNGIRPYGNTWQSNGPVPQDLSWPVRSKIYMDWLVANLEDVWKPVMRKTIVHGAEKGIEGIMRVGNGGASMEKVLVAHPL